MLEDNPFADLIPGNQPATGGLGYRPPRAAKPEIRQVGDTLGIVDPTTGSFTPTYTKPGGSEDNSPEAVKLREGESNAAYLVTNMLTGVNSLTNAIKTDPSAAYPTMGQEIAGMFGQTARNFSQPAQRQIAYGSQRTVVDAMLTLATGLTYTEEQIDAYTRGYFPQLGDEPATIADKRNKLKAAMVAARIKAGKAAPKIDEAMAALGLDAAGGFDKLGDTSDLPGFEGALPSTPASMGADGRTSAKLDLTDLGGNPRPGQVPNVVETAEEDDWPIGAVHGDWKRVDDHTIQNTRTGERSTYTGLTVVGGGDAARQREAEARARAEAYRAKQERFNPLDPRETMLVHGMSGTLSDEAAGVGGFLKNALTLQNPIEGYTTVRDAERLRIEDARRQLGGWGTALEVGGGFLSLNPEAALAPATSALATFTQGAKAGAGGGALYGFGSGEGFGDSMEKAAVGSALGAFAGAAVPAIGMGASRLATPLGRDVDLAAAAQAENVRLRSPMLNDNSRRIKMGGLEGTSGGAPVIQRAIQETTDDISAAATRAGGPGAVYDDTGAAGEVVQSAGRRFIQRTKGVADRLYNRARSLAGPDATVTPREGLSQLRRELQDLRQAENVNKDEIDFINDIGADLTKGPLTVEAIRAIRQSVRGRTNVDKLVATQAEARAHRILDALQQDVTASLPSAAASAFRRADTYYRERMIHIDDILEKFIGNNKAGETRLSGEKAFAQLRSMTAQKGGDSRRLAALWRDMTPDEQADISATIMNAIGRRANQTDAPFSIDLFLTQASSLSPSARRTIFGPSGAESVNRLIRLSRALQDAQKEVNKTKSGSTVMRTIGGTLAAALMGGGGGAVMSGAGTGALVAGGTIAGMLAKVGANNLSARALMSPRVSTWLADVANATTGAQIQALGRRLGVIAAREPALANELVPLQQALSGQARVPLAAAEGEDDQ